MGRQRKKGHTGLLATEMPHQEIILIGWWQKMGAERGGWHPGVSASQPLTTGQKTQIYSWGREELLPPSALSPLHAGLPSELAQQCGCLVHTDVFSIIHKT